MSTTEVFNASQVKSVMSDIESEFSDLSSLIEETNSLVTSALGSPDKAVYGDAGNKILATWDENCSTLSSFINIFNNWSLVAVSVASEYGELDTGTAKVEGTDLEAFKAISGANKTTWLKTSEGASNYTGSKNSYMDPTTNNTVSEQSSLSNRREITYTDASGNKITEYYNLAGELIGISKNGKLYDANGKSVSEIGTKEELERADKIKKAQASLKDSVKTKHEELDKRNKEREEKAKFSGEVVTNNGIIDTSKPVLKGTKYNLSDDDLAHLAYVAYREQGSVEGAKLELSLMCNLYEKNKSRYSSVRDYVDNSGWFAKGSRVGYYYPGDAYYNAAKEVVNDGKRYLPAKVVEHDCLSDISSISTGSPNNRSDYIPGKTVCHNVYGANYVFVGFAPNGGDPFGYLV